MAIPALPASLTTASPAVTNTNTSMPAAELEPPTSTGQGASNADSEAAQQAQQGQQSLGETQPLGNTEPDTGADAPAAPIHGEAEVADNTATDASLAPGEQAPTDASTSDTTAGVLPNVDGGGAVSDAAVGATLQQTLQSLNDVLAQFSAILAQLSAQLQAAQPPVTGGGNTGSVGQHDANCQQQCVQQAPVEIPVKDTGTTPPVK